MRDKIVFTTVVSNCVLQPGLLAERGASLFIQYQDKSFLFDTGSGEVLLLNALHLDIDLNSIDGVILSHGHKEHSGGVKNLLAFKPKVLYAHPLAFEEKFIRDSDDLIRNASCPVSSRYVRLSDTKLSLNVDREIIMPGFILSGEIPLTIEKSVSPEEHFFRWNPYGFISDSIIDEQFLAINSKEGWIIVTGSSHRGLNNIIDKAKEITRTDRFYMLLGRLHFSNIEESTLIQNAEVIKEHFEKVVPLSFSGLKETIILNRILGKRIIPLFTGDSIEV